MILWYYCHVKDQFYGYWLIRVDFVFAHDRPIPCIKQALKVIFFSTIRRWREEMASLTGGVKSGLQ